MSIRIVGENNCYGCTACYAVCPVDAISMNSSSKGFYVPSVELGKCVDCGKCEAVCPDLNSQNLTREGIGKCYAVRHKKDEVRYLSSSGGAFSSIVEEFAKHGRCHVFGAALEDCVVRHIRVSPNDISPLRKSKYVQSDLSDSFKSIFNLLKNSERVVFSGTPCQCQGLNLFLKEKRQHTENLLLIDFVCHGTLSPRLFADYIAYCEHRQGKRISDHCFRDKSNGWHTYIARNSFDDGSTDSKSFSSQLFTQLFYTNYSFKEKCYSCDFSTLNRVSDITLADFWGIEKKFPQFDDNLGASFVIVNTQKGNSFFSRMDSSYYFEVSIDDTAQAHLNHPVARPVGNDMFWTYYFKHGFSKMCVKYLKAGKTRRFLSMVYRSCLKFVR